MIYLVKHRLHKILGTKLVKAAAGRVVLNENTMNLFIQRLHNAHLLLQHNLHGNRSLFTIQL
jgi:hypothetical protein